MTQAIVGNFDLSPLVKRDTGKLNHIQKLAKSKRLQKSWILKHFYFRLRILSQFKVYANTPKSEKLKLESLLVPSILIGDTQPVPSHV